jgi:hypothetical protein
MKSLRLSVFVVVGMAATTVCTISYAQQGVTGMGSTSFIPLWTSVTNIADSVMYQSGPRIGINTINPSSALDVNGDINFKGILRYQGMPLLEITGRVSDHNTAVGLGALNTTGQNSTAVGALALSARTSGNNNTAIGALSLQSNTTGTSNTAVGFEALSLNTSGSENIAVGEATLGSNLAGQGNTAIGFAALLSGTGTQNTALGQNALSFLGGGNSNIAIGALAGGQLLGNNSNNILIGSTGLNTDSGAIRIGAADKQSSFYAAGVAGSNVSGVPLLVDTATGQLGIAASSRRFKKDIHDMDDASAGLMRLRAVTFRYQAPFADGSNPVEYGLIAEEVEQVYPDLVARSADGQIESVRYQVLDSMLLNEVQRLNRENRDLQQRLARLEAAINKTAPQATQ